MCGLVDFYGATLRPPIGVRVSISGPPSEQGERGKRRGRCRRPPILNPPPPERVGMRGTLIVDRHRYCLRSATPIFRSDCFCSFCPINIITATTYRTRTRHLTRALLKLAAYVSYRLIYSAWQEAWEYQFKSDPDYDWLGGYVDLTTDTAFEPNSTQIRLSSSVMFSVDRGTHTLIEFSTYPYCTCSLRTHPLSLIIQVKPCVKWRHLMVMVIRGRTPVVTMTTAEKSL